MFKIKMVFNEIKYFIQRGIRGYSDRDVWGLDNYLNEVLSTALLQLNKDRNGCPCRAVVLEGQTKWTSDNCSGCSCMSLWRQELIENAEKFRLLTAEGEDEFFVEANKLYDSKDWHRKEWGDLVMKGVKEQKRVDKEAWTWLAEYHGALWD